MNARRNAGGMCGLRRFNVRRVFSVTALLILLFAVLTAQPVTYAFTNGQAASLVLGQPNFTTNSYETSQTELKWPTGVAFDSHGNLWVADSGNTRVLEHKCTATSSCTNGDAADLVLGQSSWTSYTETTSQTGLDWPEGLGFDSYGDLWVADYGSNRILEYTCTATSSCTNSNNAALVLGQSSWTSFTPATSPTGLFRPAAIVFDSHGNLWVTDMDNNRVLEYTCTATNSCTDGNAAALVLGQPDLDSHTVTTSQTGLWGPSGAVFDSHGNLWVADGWNNRVLEYSCTASGSCTDDNAAALILGQSSWTSYTHATSPTGLWQPVGVVFDSQGNLWVADMYNNRTLEYTCTATSNCSTDNAAALVLGQPDFNSGTGATSPTGLSWPYGMVFDSHGNLWVTDYVNNRVLEYPSSGVITSTNASTSASIISNSTQTGPSPLPGLSGTTSTLSPTTLLLTGVIVVLVVLIALVMLRRSKPTGPATTRGLRAGVIYCEQCGAQSPATKQFCEKCGAKLQP